MSRREYFKEENRIKKLAVVFSVVLILTIIAFAFIFNLYNKKLQESARSRLMELGSINAVVPNQIQIENVVLEPASASQDKGINEVNNEIVNETVKEVITKHNEEKIEDAIQENVDNPEEASETENEDGYIAPANENFEPSFIAPVSGEIIKDFASDSLVFSKTLDEWTTHYGIDIRADKMTVVAASEMGTVESIKNDPRYRINYYHFSS